MKYDFKLSIRIKSSTKKKLEAIAKKEDRTISYIVNRILEKHLKGFKR